MIKGEIIENLINVFTTNLFDTFRKNKNIDVHK